MKTKTILNKKLKINRDNHNFFYTVKEIKEKNENYILFVDKFGNEIYTRWIDVIEII